MGSTPSTLKLPAAEHVIVIEKSGFKAWRRTMNVLPGSNLTIKAELESDKSPSTLQAQPGGASSSQPSPIEPTHVDVKGNQHLPENVKQPTDQKTEQAPSNPGPERKLCLCEFRLSVSFPNVYGGGLLGGIASGVALANASKYATEILPQVQSVYETALAGSASFQYISHDKLIPTEGRKVPPLAETAQKNQLLCVSGKTLWATKRGFSGKLAVNTNWEIAGRAGCHFKMKTSVISEEKYGLGSYGSDVKLKPAYLDLAKEDAKQFRETLSEEMKKAGCTE
jgi:hypothetical protein